MENQRNENENRKNIEDYFYSLLEESDEIPSKQYLDNLIEVSNYVADKLLK